MAKQINEIKILIGKDADRFAEKMLEKENKVYPDDYSDEERSLIKEIVLARLKNMPSNLRLSIG